MEKIINELKREKLKYIIISVAIVIILLIGVFKIINIILNHNLKNVDSSIVTIYGDFMVIDYEVDGQQYKDISYIPKSRRDNPTKDLVVMCYKNSPQNAYIEYPYVGFYAGLITGYFIINLLLIMVNVRNYNKDIYILKNGELVEAEVVDNTAFRMILKWNNPYDNKCYYYTFLKSKIERRWIEKIDKLNIMVNKQDFRKFYVVGRVEV